MIPPSRPTGAGRKDDSLVGAANVVPVVFSAAARTPGMPAGTGVASVATLGAAGFLAAPPVLGLVGERFGLSAALTLVLVMGLVIAAVGRRP